MSITFSPQTSRDNLWEEASLNVSNANGLALLSAMGVEADYCGSMDAEAFLGHVLVGLATCDDSALEPCESMGFLGMLNVRVHDMGRREGYMSDRLNVLRDIALTAQEHGLAVTWS